MVRTAGAPAGLSIPEGGFDPEQEGADDEGREEESGHFLRSAEGGGLCHIGENGDGLTTLRDSMMTKICDSSVTCVDSTKNGQPGNRAAARMPAACRPDPPATTSSTCLLERLALAALAAAALTLAAGPVVAQPGPVRVLINHVGYDQGASKKFVVQAERDAAVSGFQVIDGQGRSVFEGKLAAGGSARLGQVDNWKRWRFLRGDFTAFDKPGSYRIRVLAAVEGERRQARSEPFAIAPRLLADAALSDLVFYFKSQRSSGIYDQTDRAVPFVKNPGKRADLHGGWYDASGDVSKYLSHLSYANYMNPQQTPLLVWALLQSSDLLAPVKTDRAQGVRQRMQDEALYGGDFLVRMQDPAGFFYLTVFDGWSYEAPKREICAYETEDGKKTTDWQAGMREGGGMAIAALARVSTLKRKGDYPAARYLAVAEKGWAHLAANNLKYLDDKQENIIDDYTALVAATELYAATRKPAYLTAARQRQQALVKRLHDDEKWKGFWRADAKGERPYFHAAEAGLPVVALLRYRAVETDAAARQAALAAVEKSLTLRAGRHPGGVQPVRVRPAIREGSGRRQAQRLLLPAQERIRLLVAGRERAPGLAGDGGVAGVGRPGRAPGGTGGLRARSVRLDPGVEPVSTCA